MRIGDRDICARGSVYIIAELGVNHDGSVERALEMVDEAASCGADAIKTQWFEPERLMSQASKLAAYQQAAGERDPFEMLRRLQLTPDGMARVVERAQRRNVHAIVTVFSEELVPQAESLAWDAYKTASPDIVHLPLIAALVRADKPLILSTGAATMDEITRAVGWVGSARHRLAVLQCVSSYPTPAHDASLGGIGALAETLKLPVGYSDHTPEEDTGALAVALGAAILEKHFTHDRRAVGPDHAASLDPEGFSRYVRAARAACVDPPRIDPADPRIGPRVKRVLPIEQDVRSLSRQSVVARRALASGEPIRPEDLTCKRPGAGIPPWRLHEVIARRTTRAIAADSPIHEEDLA